jgi:hypothetical protein
LYVFVDQYAMARITIYLDDDLLAQVKAAAKAAQVSQSQWIADAVRLRSRTEWPAAVRALAGAWPDSRPPSRYEVFGRRIYPANTRDDWY